MSFNWFSKKKSTQPLSNNMTNNVITSISMDNKGSGYALTSPTVSPMPAKPASSCTTSNYSSINTTGTQGNTGGWNTLYNSGGVTSIYGTVGGAITSINVIGGASTAYYPSATLSTLTYPNPSDSAISIHGANGKILLSIKNNGDVIISGSANEAARNFQKLLGFNIDKNAVGEKALIKSYKRAIERCLRQIKNMDKDEFIAMLENEVEVRNEKDMLLYLKESPEEIKE